MNTVQVRKFSVSDYPEETIENNHFMTPKCQRQVPHLSIVKKAQRRKIKISPKRLSFSPNDNSFVIQSPREMNHILKNLKLINNTIWIENLLKSKNMEKYVENFRNQDIDNLGVFSTLTERDLVEIGINNNKDRLIILEIAAEHGEMYS